MNYGNTASPYGANQMLDLSGMPTMAPRTAKGLGLDLMAAALDKYSDKSGIGPKQLKLLELQKKADLLDSAGLSTDMPSLMMGG